jgi:cytochrome c oxidase subunit 2
MTIKHLLNLVPISFSILLTGCEREDMQSVLAPRGPEAERILGLLWLLAISSAVIVCLVVVLIFASLSAGRWRHWLARESAIIAGGIVLPVAVLTILLMLNFLLTGAGSATPGISELRISVIGEQWWWRIGYATADGRRFETANEVHLPVNASVAIELSSADVIHSFWVPRLAGKLDMIPGHKTILHLQTTEPGVSRGQCAEYCGGPHAFMSFHVVAMEGKLFQSWLSQQTAPALPPATPLLRRGQELFLAAGCAGCHTIRGTGANGVIGPDLTHVASRISLAAATLPNDQSAFARWIVDNQHIKPENRMPVFHLFTETELTALSAYLANLK